MSKTSIKQVEVFDEGDFGYYADLWKDDDSGELSVSLPDPFDGITSSKYMTKLSKFCEAAAKKMKSAGQ